MCCPMLIGEPVDLELFMDYSGFTEDEALKESLPSAKKMLAKGVRQPLMQPNVLLIAPETAAEPIAEAVRSGLGAEVQILSNRRSALTTVRRKEFDLILIDEGIAASDAATTEQIYQNSGGAFLLELNLALWSAERIVRQARAALARRSQEFSKVKAAAAAELRNELNASLAGLLLEAQLALREATPAQTHRLRNLVKLASDLRDRLRGEN